MKEPIKILITGPPRCGKTTLVSEISSELQNLGYKTCGFITTEVKSGKYRIGFRARDIITKNECWLARKGGKDTKYMLGRYNVYIEQFNILLNEIFKDFTLSKSIDLCIVDEIGKMELFSENFISIISDLFTSNISILATIGQKIKHPIKEKLLGFKDIQLYSLDSHNFNEIKTQILTDFK